MVFQYGLEQTDKDIIPVDYKGVARTLNRAKKSLWTTEKSKLKSLKSTATKVRAKVVHGELLKPRKGLNIPGATKSLSAITERDVDFIKFAVDNDADYLALIICS